VFAEVASARVFCAPSITASDNDAEALGMVFAEAQALGTPIVSFRSGGVPEVVQHEVTGLLAQEKDVVGLATHLLRYLRDHVFHEQSSRAAVTWVQRQFDIRKQTRALESIYSQCIEEHAAHPIKRPVQSGSALMELPL
jgi:glycosyltransferase involved in cell wall biosynthesis